MNKKLEIKSIAIDMYVIELADRQDLNFLQIKNAQRLETSCAVNIILIKFEEYSYCD